MTVTVSLRDGGEVQLAGETVEQLRAAVEGEVVAPADPGFADVRPVFNAMHGSLPGLAVRCRGTADVVASVNFAREHGLLLAVRGGGHSIAGLSAGAGGLLIDLSPMNGVQVDTDAKLARVQGGALWADVDRECQAFGLATPGGVVSDTGVAGLTLGGGYGWLRRKYGLSCDNVVAAEVVCADGEVRTASASSNPDLYWAIRGGGGNFGVVTSFTFRLHPVGPIVAFAGIFYPVDQAVPVLTRWREAVAGMPDEVSSVVVSFTFPAAPSMPPAVHDRDVVIVGAVHAGADLEAAMAVLQPLRELGTPLVDLSQPMPFTFVQSAFDALLPRGQFQSYWKSQYLDELSDGAIAAFKAVASSRPAPLTVINVWHMGGAIGAVAAEDTAFAQRSAPFMISIDGNWTDPADNEANVAWVRDRWADIAEFGTGEVYLNFTGLAGEAPAAGVDTALGRNLQRLAEIKATYDPDNLFRRNNNIAPVR